jgi:hypothetical protein
MLVGATENLQTLGPGTTIWPMCEYLAGLCSLRHPIKVLSKKIAAVQSLSPTETIQQPHVSKGDQGRSDLEELGTSDPHLEARIHLAARQTIAAMGVPTLQIRGSKTQST